MRFFSTSLILDEPPPAVRSWLSYYRERVHVSVQHCSHAWSQLLTPINEADACASLVRPTSRGLIVFFEN